MSWNRNRIENYTKEKDQKELKWADGVRDFLEIQKKLFEKTTRKRIGKIKMGEMEGVLKKIIGENQKEMEVMMGEKFNPKLIKLFEEAWFKMLDERFPKTIKGIKKA